MNKMIVKSVMVVILVVYLSRSMSSQVTAQDDKRVSVTVQECTSDVLPTRSPSLLQGRLYFYQREDDFGHTSLLQTSRSSNEQAMIPSSTTRELSIPTLTSNGRLVAFVDYDNNSLVVWDTQTDETAEVNLNQAENANLAIRKNKNSEQEKIIWQNAETLILQFLNPDVEDEALVIAQQRFAVSLSPLVVKRSNYQATTIPAISKVEHTDRAQLYLSPKGTYTVLVDFRGSENGIQNTHLQIYNSADLSLRMDTSTFTTNDAMPENIWTQDEAVVFFRVRERRMNEEAHITDTLYQAESEKDFKPDSSLSQRLIEVFGTEFTVNTAFTPLISPNNQKFAFRIQVGTEAYLVIYDWKTRIATAVCDPTRFVIADLVLSFWSPDSRYVGYYDDSYRKTFVLDTQISTLFELSTSEAEFIDWLP